MTTIVNVDFPTEQDPASYSIADGLIYIFFGTGLFLYYALPGANNNFTSIWTDTSASSTKGKLYVATNNALIVIDAESKTVTDYYTQTNQGRSGNALSSGDAVDINKINRGS